jgi:hypothetical protein
MERAVEKWRLSKGNLSRIKKAASLNKPEGGVPLKHKRTNNKGLSLAPEPTHSAERLSFIA